jgi:hypothetical protein
MGFVVVAHWCVEPPRLRTQHLQKSILFAAILCEISGSFLVRGTTLEWSAFKAWLRIGLYLMKTERFVGHHEAREALVLSVASVMAIMLPAYLLLLILY